MPDISLCQNETCAIHLNCYRFMALPSQHQQSYGEFDDDDCAEYLPLNLEQSRMVRMGRKAALAEAISEWEKPYGLTGGTKFIDRLRKLKDQA